MIFFITDNCLTPIVDYLPPNGPLLTSFWPDFDRNFSIFIAPAVWLHALFFIYFYWFGSKLRSEFFNSKKHCYDYIQIQRCFIMEQTSTPSERTNSLSVLFQLDLHRPGHVIFFDVSQNPTKKSVSIGN